MRLWFVLALLGCALMWCTSWGSVLPRSPQNAHVVVNEEPEQHLLSLAAAWSFHGYQITPLASFSVRARVLHSEHYYADAAAKLSPVDLALGWGPMSDEDVLQRFSITQGNRWYYWRVNAGEWPISRNEVVSHSANMHLIPAAATIAARLQAVREGEVISFRGYLVQVEGPHDWHWRSSLSRTDTGNGACEVVWVEQFGRP